MQKTLSVILLFAAWQASASQSAKREEHMGIDEQGKIVLCVDGLAYDLIYRSGFRIVDPRWIPASDTSPARMLKCVDQAPEQASKEPPRDKQ